MKLISAAIYGVLAITAGAQEPISVTGARIPADLLKMNYGRLPPTIQGFDLNICNPSSDKQAVTSSQIYQALAKSNPSLQPMGRQIVLGAILHNQKHSVATVLTVVLNSAVGVLSVVGAIQSGVPANVLAGAALGSAIGQYLLHGLPALTADQVERYESQALEPALVLDGGTCVERTVFALAPPGPQSAYQNLTFHVR
jgi:hypothetical protein